MTNLLYVGAVAAIALASPAAAQGRDDSVLGAIVGQIEISNSDLESRPPKTDTFVPAPLKPPRVISAKERADIVRVIGEGLTDPLSAQFQWYPVSDANLYCGRVNAKNRMGGYVGFEVYAIRFPKKGDSRFTGLELDYPGSLLGARCKAAGYRIDEAP